MARKKGVSRETDLDRATRQAAALAEERFKKFARCLQLVDDMALNIDRALSMLFFDYGIASLMGTIQEDETQERLQRACDRLANVVAAFQEQVAQAFWYGDRYGYAVPGLAMPDYDIKIYNAYLAAARLWYIGKASHPAEVQVWYRETDRTTFFITSVNDLNWDHTPRPAHAVTYDGLIVSVQEDGTNRTGSFSNYDSFYLAGFVKQ